MKGFCADLNFVVNFFMVSLYEFMVNVGEFYGEVMVYKKCVVNTMTNSDRAIAAGFPRTVGSISRAFSSLLALLAGALAAASACGLGGIGLFMAGAVLGGGSVVH